MIDGPRRRPRPGAVRTPETAAPAAAPSAASSAPLDDDPERLRAGLVATGGGPQKAALSPEDLERDIAQKKAALQSIARSIEAIESGTPKDYPDLAKALSRLRQTMSAKNEAMPPSGMREVSQAIVKLRSRSRPWATRERRAVEDLARQVGLVGKAPAGWPEDLKAALHEASKTGPVPPGPAPDVFMLRARLGLVAWAAKHGFAQAGLHSIAATTLLSAKDGCPDGMDGKVSVPADAVRAVLEAPDPQAFAAACEALIEAMPDLPAKKGDGSSRMRALSGSLFDAGLAVDPSLTWDLKADAEDDPHQMMRKGREPEPRAAETLDLAFYAVISVMRDRAEEAPLSANQAQGIVASWSELAGARADVLAERAAWAHQPALREIVSALDDLDTSYRKGSMTKNLERVAGQVNPADLPALGVDDRIELRRVQLGGEAPSRADIDGWVAKDPRLAAAFARFLPTKTQLEAWPEAEGFAAWTAGRFEIPLQGAQQVLASLDAEPAPGSFHIQLGSEAQPLSELAELAGHPLAEAAKLPLAEMTGAGLVSLTRLLDPRAKIDVKLPTDRLDDAAAVLDLSGELTVARRLRDPEDSMRDTVTRLGESPGRDGTFSTQLPGRKLQWFRPLLDVPQTMDAWRADDPKTAQAVIDRNGGEKMQAALLRFPEARAAQVVSANRALWDNKGGASARQYVLAVRDAVRGAPAPDADLKRFRDDADFVAYATDVFALADDADGAWLRDVYGRGDDALFETAMALREVAPELGALPSQSVLQLLEHAGTWRTGDASALEAALTTGDRLDDALVSAVITIGGKRDLSSAVRRVRAHDAARFGEARVGTWRQTVRDARQWLEASHPELLVAAKTAKAARPGSREAIDAHKALVATSRTLIESLKAPSLMPHFSGELCAADVSAQQQADLRSAMELLPNPDGYRHLEGVTGGVSRASANQDEGKIRLSDSSPRATVFHEVGHFVEYAVEGAAKAAAAWRDDRARNTGDGPHTTTPLQKLLPFSGYDAHEVARTGDFLDPYVGKVYAHGSTEVISMGFERFADPDALAGFASKDSGHFLFTLGVLLAARKEPQDD